MNNNELMPMDAPDELLPSESLPMYVARHWGFPLQYHEVDGEVYYNIRDWMVGLTGTRLAKASQMWWNFRDRRGGDVIPSKEMSYRVADGRNFQMDFTTDEGLYKLANYLRVTKSRTALRVIKDFLAKAGVFVDDARRDPERASEQLAIARRNQALRSGKSEEWIATREQGVVTRKQFTSAIHRLVQDKERFGVIIGSITNDLYRGMFENDVRGLRKRLGISTKENPRDHFSRIALAYTTIAEESIRIYMADYSDRDFVPVSIIREVVISISTGIGVQVDTIAKALRIDALTGRKASDKPLTQGEFTELLSRAAQPTRKESG